MASKTVEIISRSLRTILANLPNGANIVASDELRDVQEGLVWWLPGIFEEIHPEFRYICLDGVWSAMARKTGPGEIEILGLCIFIEDQTLTPLYVRMQIAESTDEVSWLLCKLGERLKGERGETGKHGMVRLPYSSFDRAIGRVYRLDGNPDGIDWVYSVTYGKRRPFSDDCPR
jgi:hypothetical protein